MTQRSLTQTSAKSSFTPAQTGLLQRKCESCGQHTIAGGECAGCAKEKSVLQRKLTIGASNDPLEREADHIANQVMAMPARNADTKSSPLQIQRFSGQQAAIAEMEVPPSVDRALSSPGRPLDPSLREDMEQRFGHDFSRVRVHTDGAAQRSARDVNASAYTVGHNIVFGDGQFAPSTHQGKQLVAHELVHTIQQSQDEKSNSLSACQISNQNAGSQMVQRKIEVPSGTEDKFFFSNYSQREGNVYSYPEPIRNKNLSFEIFTSLFNSPRTFKLAGTSVKDIEYALIQHIDSRKGVVDFASNKKYTFAAGEEDFKMNPDYWKWGNGKFKSKEGVNLEEARADLNVHPEKYAIGCSAATQLTVKAGGKSESILSSTSEPKDWVPGESGFLENKNWDGRPGLQGENLIYMGKKMFWGHFDTPVGIKTYPEWFNQVYSWNQSAELAPDRTYPEKGLVR